MCENDIRTRLELMLSAGHPVFLFGDTVVLPVEAEDFFSDEEMEDVRAYVLSHR